MARSRRDRGPIASRSWPDCAENRGLLEAKFKLIRRGFESTKPCNRNRFHDAWKPRSPPAPSPTISSQISSLKPMYFSLSNWTFDRFVKELRKFRGRYLVHRDPPAFRLNSEGIGAVLITNFSLISSWIPLEFRTSARKNPSKFASIYENWSPILATIGLVVRFDWLSGGNLCFY